MAFDEQQLQWRFGLVLQGFIARRRLGVLDADNNPKSVYYYLKRIFQPLGLFITDEGLQGLFIHLVNETQSPFDGIVEFQLIQHGNVSVAKAGREVGIPAGGKLCLLADEAFGAVLRHELFLSFRPAKI